LKGRSRKESLPVFSRERIKGEERKKVVAVGEPMNLKVHSGGMMAVMWAKRAGRWGRGRVSAMNATFLAS
jgi:hypothetical protein